MTLAHDQHATAQRATTPPSGCVRFARRILTERNLYGSLAFAETAESLRLNLQALQVGRDDRVVGVTSSGDLLLALMTAQPEAIRGFDANPAQTALAQLKSIALATLPVDNYLRLMGVYTAPPGERTALFDTVRAHLPAPALHELHLSVGQIETGILNLGMTHLMVGAFVSVCTRLLGPATTALLLGQEGTDHDRRNALKRLHDRPAMRYLVRPLLRCLAPGLKWLFFPHRFCRISRRPNEIIADPLRAFHDLLAHGIRDNPVLCRAATGQIHPEWTAHLYNDATFASIRASRNRLTLDSTDIISGLKQINTGWATRVYLSNVPDYLSTEDLDTLIDALRRATAPGARIVYYSMYDHDLLAPLGTPLPAAELQALRQSDNVLIYPLIMVRTIAP